MPIISSGTFQLSAGSVILGGGWILAGGATSAEEVCDQGGVGQLSQAAGNTQECPPGTVVINGRFPGTYSIEVIPDPDFLLDGVTPANINSLPAGFLASLIQIHWSATLSTGAAADNSWSNFVFLWNGISMWPDWTPSDLSVAMPLAPGTSPGTNLNAFSGRWKISFDLSEGATADFGCGPMNFVGAGADVHDFYATGAYNIWSYWWTIPAVTPCGDRQDSHLALSSEMPTDPAGPWERLDPDDPSAAPAIIVDSIMPSAGSEGTEVVITGSGFGIGATVEFDGVMATSIVVVNQNRIECVAPAHAPGPTNVVITNLDGVTN